MKFFSDHRHCIASVLFPFLFSILGVGSSCAQNEIQGYKVYFADGTFNSKKILVVRKFEQSGQLFYIGVVPDNLETQIIPSCQISVTTLNWQQIFLKYSNTAYVRAIEAAQVQSFSLENSGIVHGFPKEQGVALTIDLCPSHKPLDRIIFTSLITEFAKTEMPVPVALSITGRFMLTHPEDVLWIKNLVASHKISVIWINHTYHHHFNPKVPLTDNFL